MAVNLSMFAGAGAQFFTDSGIPLAGGLIYTYAAGTTTPQAAYTTSAGNVAHANPIVLNSAGRVASGGEIWLTDAVAYKFVLQTSAAVTIGTYDNVTGNASGVAAGVYATFAASSGASLVGYTQGNASAVATTVQAKLRESVSVLDFGASTSATATANTTAFTNALATGISVFVPAGTYSLNSTITVGTAGQRLFGVGESSVLSFAFASSDNAIEITGVSGKQQINNLKILATTNCAKVISVGAPMTVLSGLTINTSTATGHGIYLENEVSPVTFSFGTHISECRISGITTTGNFGIRTALYSQASNIVGNLIENWGTGLNINGAMTQLLVQGNIFQTTSETGEAIRLDASGAALYEIAIINNYFETNQTCVKVVAGIVNNLMIRGNYAVRNTAYGSATAYFYSGTGADTSAASGNIVVNDNYVLDFGVFLNLANQYSANFASVSGNTMNSVTNYSASTYANNAFNVKAINSYYNRKLVSGSFISESNVFLSAKLAVFEVPVPWNTREYLTSITFRYEQVAGTGVTVELRKITSASATDTLVATVTVNTNIVTNTLTVGAFAEVGFNYYIKVTYDNTGTQGYVYPFQMYVRN